jgi:amino acid adenylation domain-containing protein/non-ribosomal peptide synthase protein (TIGR01720 family)
LVNNYGPTEFTICASSYQLTERDKTALPLIGKPIDNTQIYYVSEGGKLCPIGVPGELYLGGMGLAKGYINNPGSYRRKVCKKSIRYPKLCVYRTGDLGRWLPDGNLEFLGRIDDQVKIRGYRIELGEIENVLQGMEGISQAVVMARTDKAGTKRLVAYLVTNEGFDKEKAMEGLKAQLPEYMLPQFWVELQELPLTPNGKIDKKALPEPDVIENVQAIYEAPRNATEKVLVEIWEEVLGVSPIGIHDNFFELGGHSILIMRIISLVRIRLDSELSVMLVFKNPSIAQCSEIVRSQINELRLPSILKADRESRIPLSFAQERLWFIHKLEGSTQYHIPAVLKLVGDLNFQALEESLKQVINRHEILRTTIHEEDGQGYQRINAPDKWRMDWIDAKNETDSELNQRIDDLVNRPFKFEADPMLRAAIIEKGKHEFLLVVTLHHIAADGWSISIVVNEMVSLYKAFITKQSSNLQELHIQYADYAIWQKSYLKGDLLSEKLKYWTQKLSNPEPLNLLTDFPRKLRQINQGATTSLKADNSLLISLKALSQTRGMTLFMTLLAGFKALLYRYTNQGDITIGTTVAGRQQRELEPLIGFFINTLALRDNIEADDNFESLLEKVKTTVLDALEHQDLPFEKVVDAVVKEREVGRSPLFQVLFSFHNIPEIPPLELPGITISNERSRNTTSQFDIICNVTELSDGIQFSMQYNTGLYRQATIHCLLTHYVSLLSEVAERPSQKITAVTYVSQGEITELTSKFNPEKPLSIPYDTIITSIQEVVVKHSKELAFIHGNESIRFEDLNKRSNQLANWLIEKGLSNETPVAVCLDRSIDMMIAILGVLKAGATYVPVDSNSPSERLKYIVEDSGVRIIITKGELPGLTSINRVEVFDFEKESKTLDKFGEANPDLEILPNHCAYIIYTSGSTGKPKGVIVEHGSLMAYLYNGKTNYMQKAGKQTGSFIHLANTFDASLTALFLPLLNGKTAILGSGDAIEVFNDPNFLKYAPYDFLKITPAHLELLRTIFENSPKALTSKLVIGGEALKLSQWAYLKNLEYAIDIINEYGPTEATVGCISHSINTHTFQEAEGELPIGKPFDGVKIFILDISKQWVPIGVAGELYISGRQVARGYLNNLELTKERFLDTGIFEGSAYKLYKTGDLARWLPDGNIEFFGRTDEQIKIRGHRIEPGEIESAVKSLENITDCLVIAKPDQNGTNNLVAYIVSKTGFNKTEAIESLRKILPEYMFPLYWVELEQLPLNSSGKVDKKQLPEPNSQATLQEGYVLPQTQTQKALATIWCDLLEIDEIGIYDNFFDIGGHSLLAIRLIASLRKEFDVEMPILMVFDHPTIFSQESVLNELKKGDVLPQIKAMPWPERIPLSFSQERLWFIDKLEGTRAYHLPSVLKLKGNLDTNILEKSIQAIVDRHSVLRTVYLQENGVAYQSVNPKDLWQLQTMNGTSVSPDKLNETIREFVDQPFDLAKDPMVRALLVKTGKDEYVLAVTLHHIASDGWSTSILVKELVANYQAFSQGKEPEHAPLAVQYADYAIWQRTYLQGDLLAKKLEYWKTKLASPQALELQTDYPRAAMQSNKGAVVSVKTDKQLSQAIEEMSHANGSTVFMSLLAAFKVLLYRYTGQTDIVVGTPMAGRQQQELEPLIGFFINTLALRDELNLEQTFNEVLQQVKQTTLEAYQHQDVPFEKIVDAVVKERDLSRSPLFQVMFVFQNTPEVPKLQLGDIELSRESSEHITAQFELTLSVSESKSGLNLSLSYRTDLFSEQTVKQILIHFHSILHQIVSNPEKPVGEYRLLGEKQEQELLRSNASIERSYDNKQTLVSLFSQRVLQSPKAIALEFKDRQITYEALEAQSNQLAWYLLDQKVKPRELIAISMERSPEMIVGLMGILKAGAAYVPIDPNYPALRKAYMLKDSKARFVITETPVETENCKAIKPISGREELKHYPTTNPAIEIKPEDLAYVIYTSGSTGTPKGVMVEHQSVVNLICAQSEYFKIDETERILQFSNLSFDASVEQIFLALSAGGTLVLFEEGLQLKSGVFEQFITEKGITHFHATPGFIETLNITQPNSLRRIIAGGDWCKAELANKYQGKYDFYNEYGPTETTVTALIYKAENQIRSLPIGKGLANTNVYVLSETQNLQPLGVPGEIYISGIQVARGYLNRKEQSEAVFLNDPFKQGQRMYRTGDMGRWLADGNLEYLGRKDEQVKIRGYRIELGEIETAIERLPTVKQSAVLAKADAQGHKRLVAYVVKQEGYNKEQIMASLKESLPEYMVPQIWVEVEQIALTANGKVDRKTLPEPDMEGQIQSQYVPARTQTEQDLVEIWQDLLGIKRIGIYDNFFELGGDSILTIQLVSRASKKGYQLQPKDIFIHQKIASLAEWLEIGRNQISMAEQGLLEGVFNLLPIQYDFFNRGIKQTSHYNQSLLLAIDKRVSSDNIGACLKSLVKQHDALRLQFINQEGQLMQTYTLAEPELLIQDISALSEANLSKKVTERAAYYQKTLAIEKGIVFQAVWMKMPDSETHNRLLLIAHHLVVDGVSWRIILEDLETLISAHNSNQVSEIGPKTTSYRQWAEALVKYGQTPEIKAQKTYWDNACSLHTALPTDFETLEALLVEHLSIHAVNINASLTEQLLQQVPKAYQTEINDILLTSLVLTITNWTKASALRIGLEGHGRESFDDEINTSRTVGWFTTLYPVLLECDSKNPGNLIKSVKEQLRQIPNKGLGYGILKYLQKESVLQSDNPWDLVFNYFGQLDGVAKKGNWLTGAKESTGLNSDSENEIQDKLTINSRVQNGKLSLSWTFSQLHFKKETIEQLASKYIENLEALIQHCVNVQEIQKTPSDYGLQSVVNYREFDAFLQQQWGDDSLYSQIESVYPLSALQQGMLFHSLYDENGHAYMERFSWELQNINQAYFEQSWELVLQNHSILRSVFFQGVFKIPVQAVFKKVPLPIQWLDYRHLSEEDQIKAIKTFETNDSALPFDFESAPLMRIAVIRISDQRYKMFWTSHHILFDGWSIPVLTDEFLSIYQSLQNQIPLGESKVDYYEDYIRYIAQKNKWKEQDFWQTFLRDVEEPTLLPWIHNSSMRNKGEGRYESKSIKINSSLTQQAQLFAQGKRITMNTLIQGVWSKLLHHFTGNTTVVYGVVVSGRPDDLINVEKKVGLFINTLPHRTNFSAEISIQDYLQTIQDEQLKAREYQYSSLSEIQSFTSVTGDLFDTLVVFENYPVSKVIASDKEGLKVEKVKVEEHTNYPLTLLVGVADEILVSFSYNTALLDEETIAKISTRFSEVLGQMIGDDLQLVSQISLLTEDERKQLLSTSLEVRKVDYPREQTLVSLFEERVVRSPFKVALAFEEHSMTYQELNQKANQLANMLRSKGVKPDSLVPICLERSLEMIVGILGILKAGGAYVPIDPLYPEDRIRFMIKDCNAGLVVTAQEGIASLQNEFEFINLSKDLESLEAFDTADLKPLAGPENLAYIIYTSGSTGKPKGVMIENKNVVRLFKNDKPLFDFNDRDVWTMFHSFCFDFSVWEMYGALLYGGKLVIVPESCTKDTKAFAELVHHEQVTVLNQTPSAFQVLQEYMTSEFEEIPFRYVIFGGEALQPASLKTWNSSYPQCQLINMYGITETTVHVTYLALNTQHFQSNISSIGKPIPTLSVYVLDVYGNLQLPGIEGEMYVGGEGLARGYLNNPLLTEERFIPNPLNAYERLYKTGDLAKWALDGSLEYLGRIDEQVKIRGFRIELGEIENTLLQFEEVSQAVVLAKADAFDVKRLVAYLVAKEEFEKDRAIEHLKQTLPDYMIPSFWVVLPEMPLTRNGKIDKKALPDVELAIQDGNESEESLSETEHRLLKIWQELLGHKAIRTGSNFFEIGGHSLLAMRLMTALRREFDVEIRIKDIFSNPTLSELAKHIQAQNKTLEVPLMLPVSDSETHIPLSFAQERLWFIDKLEGSRQFNLPIVLNLKGHIDANLLERCLNEIVNRHKVLRTVFVERNGEVVSELKPKNEWKLQRLSHGDVSSQAIDSLILHPFDLSRDYMVRSSLLELSAEESVLVTVLHHIATDAWSNGVLVKEVMELYSAFTQGRTPDLKPLLLQYSDYAIWQRRYLQGDVLERKIAYWKQKLSETAFLDLPTDYVRPAQRGIAGAIEGFSIPIELSQSVNTLSKSIGTTLFMTLLSVYKVLLSKYSRQQDICVGTSIANRPQQELEELIGFFVNTLALRTELLEQDTFSGLLEKVKQTTLEAYANQEAPFEKVVETMVKGRDPSRSPLFQVMLVLANTPEASRLKLGELELSRRGHKSKISKFDLTFHFNETPGGLQLSVEYSTDLFRSSTIHRMVDHFITLLTSITENPQQKLQDISIASTPEQTLLLTVFGQHIVTYPPNKTITELFEWQAAQTPDQTALTFENKKLTYLQLNQQANQLAHALIEQGVKPETLVPIYLNKGQGMIVAILGVLKAGGAYVPIDSEFPLSRVDYMLKDSGAKLLLSERALSKNLDSSIRKFNLDELDLNLQPTSNPQTKAKANSLAYVIYTSGSTGQPKGVMIEHGNLTDYVFGLKQNTPIDQCSNHALVSTIATDLGNTVIYGSLLSGGNLHVFSKETTSDPEALSNYFKQNQIDCLKIVPSHYKALSQQQPLLPQKLLIFGGEALKSEDVKAIQQADPNLTIVNHYGPTETTIGKLLHTIESKRVYGKTIPIGKPFSNTKVYVLDAQQHLSPIGVPGQLYIAGDGLARGYLNNEALTNEKFTLNPYNQTRMYATGDLVKYLEDGNLEYLGRIDQQVKIRGYRIELSEIERALNQIPTINQSVVIAKEDKQGNKQLLAYVVGNKEFDKPQTIQVLKQSLPDYMIPASITQIDEIPLTLNGKIDYKALPDPEQSGQGGYSAPQDETEQRLAEIWQEILEVDQVGRNDDFFELGGHSLLAIRLISAVRKAFETEMPIGDIFDYPTIAQLKTRLNKSHAVLPAITPQPKAGPIPLSFSQERLWFIDKLEGSRQYHIPSVLRLKGELNIEALQNSIQQIVNRHEILRTTIQEIDGQGYQYIKAKDLWKLQQKLNVTQEQLPELVKQLIDKPFNLNADDMLRASLLELENTDHVLVVTLHHIASDGWSTSILVKELVKLYESYIHKQNPNLAALPVQYADYAIWQRTYLQGELLETKLDYWKDKLQGAAPLDLPTDYPRPALQSNKGAVSGFKTDKPLSDKLNELSKAKGTTLFMTLLAAFKVLLYRYSNQSDITIGTPMAGRQQQELEGLIGFFINTLALRDELNPEHSFDQLLQQVKTTTLEAYQHQDVPFEKVVEAVTQNRDLSRSPVFQVMFVFQNTPDIPQLQLGEVRLSRNAVEHVTAQFDLRCTISDTERGMFISMEYCTDLFSQQTIERMNGHFAHLLEHIAQNPNAKLCDYELLAEQETHQLLTEFNATQTQYPEDKTILDLFAQQVNKSPNSTSVVYENQSLSFKELDEKSNQLANYLIELGVKPDSLVAICMERSLEMMVGILGILKANAAYVPIDPDYPQQRIEYMLEDCKASIILSHSEVKISLPNNVVMLDTDWEQINQQPKTKPAIAPEPNHLAYVIYTSGSTGHPKGVMNEHSGLLNRLCWAQDYFKLTSKDKVLQKTTYSFDVSVWELLWPLISGAQLVFAKPGGHKDNVYLKEIIEKEQITMLHFVPSMLEVFLSDLPEEACPSLKQVLCSGEALKPSQVELFGQKLPQSKLFNLYGPTEAAIDVTCWEIEPNTETVPIGKPVANTQIYILNQQNQPVPIGVAGEIHIGGVQVARGYLNKAELTNEKFIPNPYSKTKTERLYKTGDLGKWTEDGTIEYLGRLDDQVKIRGYRIELGEIETAIEQLKEIKQSAALAKDDAQGNKRLVAYVVSRKAFDKSKIMAELQQKLPEYMVPQIWVELKELPLTPNGKTDRKALPEPDISEQLKDQYVAPRNETEQKLAEIWKKILKLEKIGIHDNFFELGGHSLMALRIISGIRRAFNVEIEIIALVQHPSIIELGQIIERAIAEVTKEQEQGKGLESKS